MGNISNPGDKVEVIDRSLPPLSNKHAIDINYDLSQRQRAKGQLEMLQSFEITEISKTKVDDIEDFTVEVVDVDDIEDVEVVDDIEDFTVEVDDIEDFTVEVVDDIEVVDVDNIEDFTVEVVDDEVVENRMLKMLKTLDYHVEDVGDWMFVEDVEDVEVEDWTLVDYVRCVSDSGSYLESASVEIVRFETVTA